MKFIYEYRQQNTDNRQNAKSTRARPQASFFGFLSVFCERSGL